MKYWYAVIEVYRWHPRNGKSLCIVKSTRKTGARLPRWIQAKYKNRRSSIIFRLSDFKIAIRDNARKLLESKLNQWMSEEEFKELADAVANAIKTRKARERFENAVKEILETEITRRDEGSKKAKYYIIKYTDIPVFIRRNINFDTGIYVSKKYYVVGTPYGSVYISKQAIDEGDDCIGPTEHVHLDLLDIMKSATSLFYKVEEKDGRILSSEPTTLAGLYPKLACFFRKFIENYREIELGEDVELSTLLERVKSLEESLREMLTELKYNYIDYYSQILNREERSTLYDVLKYIYMKRVITNNPDDLISKINRVIQILNEHIEKLKKAYTEKKLFG
jgi:hypothetical protein